MFTQELKRFSNRDETLLEIKRQLFHLLLISVWCVPIYLFPYPVVLSLFTVVIVINTALVLNVSTFRRLFAPILEHLERDRNMSRPGLQALYANVGILISYLLFGSLSIVGVLVLAVGDSFSTLIGKLLGKTPVFYNEEKSWEGSLAFFLSSYIVLVFVMDLREALFLSLSGALLESFKLRLDDNLTLPIFATSLAYLV